MRRPLRRRTCFPAHSPRLPRCFALRDEWPQDALERSVQLKGDAEFLEGRIVSLQSDIRLTPFGREQCFRRGAPEGLGIVLNRSLVLPQMQSDATAMKLV